MTHAVHVPVRPVHDKPTLLAFASIATWSWFVYGLGATLALLSDEQGSASWVEGLHGSALALGGVLGALAAPTLIRRFGRGRTLRVGVIGTTVLIALFLIPGTPPAWTLSTLLVSCFFGNLIVVCVNAFIAIHQGPASPPAFTESLALSALTGLLAPLTIGLATASVLGWRAGLGVSIGSFLVIEVLRGRRLAVYDQAEKTAAQASSGPLPRLTFWAIFAGTAYIGAEFSMNLWGVELIRERTGLSAALAAAGLGTLLGGIFVGRAFGAALARRVSSETLLRWSLVAGLVLFTAMWLSTATAIMLSALFLTGLSLSMVWPMSVARILRSAAGAADRASSLTLAFTTTAIGVAPFILGSLAGSMPVHQAFLLVPVLLVTALVLVLFRPVPELLPADTEDAGLSPAR